MLCVVAGVVGYLLTRPQQAVLPGPHPGSSQGATGSALDDAASGLVTKLADRLAHGSRAEVLALAAPGRDSARRELADLYANVHALRIRDLSLRYVDDEPGRLDAAAERRLGGRAFVADVQLGWRIAGYDQHVAHQDTTLTLARTAGGAGFVTARGDYGTHVPLWMLDRLRVRRTPGTLVMAAPGAPLARFGGLADQAVRDVRKVLTGWRGSLVVEVPRDQAELDQVLGSGDHTYDKIAAVTTTSDGSDRAAAPSHVFVNPPVFDPLGVRGSQIVMSHEATHVATGAATVSMPTWLMEGFADFVALDHVDLSVDVTASQILAQVRKHGVPAHLPGKTEFDPSQSQLGASYEAAWLACRLIGQTYGEQKMIAFYERSSRDGSTGGAFRDVLGTSEPAFTAAWRRYLRGLAR